MPKGAKKLSIIKLYKRIKPPFKAKSSKKRFKQPLKASLPERQLPTFFNIFGLCRHPVLHPRHCRHNTLHKRRVGNTQFSISIYCAFPGHKPHIILSVVLHRRCPTVYPPAQGLQRMTPEIVPKGYERSPVTPACINERKKLFVVLYFRQSFPLCPVPPYVQRIVVS